VASWGVVENAGADATRTGAAGAGAGR